MIIIHEDDRGLIMQTMVRGQQIQIDPQLISAVIGGPVLPVSEVPFPEEAPSIDFLHDFFGMRPHVTTRFLQKSVSNYIWIITCR
jgi:hypothetical protein